MQVQLKIVTNAIELERAEADAAKYGTKPEIEPEYRFYPGTVDLTEVEYAFAGDDGDDVVINLVLFSGRSVVAQYEESVFQRIAQFHEKMEENELRGSNPNG
jgi:hypothetical protein